jgi:hypothetical protein
MKLLVSSALVGSARVWSLTSLFGIILLQPGPLAAEPVAVRYREGSVHGFLALRTLEGKILAAGDLTQTVRGNRVVSRLVFRFKDGSVDDETAIFSQQHNFRLIRYHHIQTGPSFPVPMDVSINASTGQVTVRYTDNGHKKVETERLDLQPDLANGIVLNILKNIRPDAAETKVSYVAATPKPRLVKLMLSSAGVETVTVAGSSRRATHYVAKVDISGLTGALASLAGRQPPDNHLWILATEAPTFLESEGPLYVGGPSWRIELTSPVPPAAPATAK